MSLLVAEISRISTGITLLLPIRVTFRFCSTVSSLACNAMRKVSDFVHKEGTAVGRFEFTRTAFVSVGKRSAFVSEQFTFEERFADSPHIDAKQLTGVSGR